jgi:quinol monooxygenase YgiN
MQVRFHARPGKGRELARVLLEAADALADLEACRIYLVSRLPDSEDAVWVTEVWTDAEAHSASLELEATKALIERSRPLIAGAPEPTELTPLGGKGL